MTDAGATALSDIHGMFDMSGRVVVITGGSRGLGFGLARGYAAAGATVVIGSRDQQACMNAASALRDAGGTAHGLRLDTGDLTSIRRFVEDVGKTAGAIDVVINNAAAPRSLHQSLGAMDAETWASGFDINVRGPVFLVQEALPLLTASSHAAVLNILTVGVFGFRPGISLYAATKTALQSFTWSMAAEFGPQGVRVNSIAPGPVETDRMGEVDDAHRQRLADGRILRRLATPDELVGPALLLTSDAGSFITGQTLVVDGGSVAH